MLENLAYLHYSCIYEQGEAASEVCLEPQNWLVPLAICVCLGNSQAAEAAPLLQYGDFNEAVISLQNQLKQANCLPQENPSNGDFNNATYAAVTNFQQQNGLSVDGIVGEQTYAALANNRTCNAAGAGLKLGDKGKEVRLMQIQLNNWGFPLDPNRPRIQATGEFDAETQRALREFEKYFGLKQDGTLTPQDSKALWASRGVFSISAQTTLKPEQVLFAVTRYRNNYFDIKDEAAEFYNPLSTSCSDTEIKKYLSKAITGGAEASPFVDEFGPLLACGSKAALDLVAILSTDNEHARFNAVIALGEMGAVANDKVVPALIKVVENDPNPLIRAYAIKSLGLISPLTGDVQSTLSKASGDSTPVPGSDSGANDTLRSISWYAQTVLDTAKESKPEYRDASCPIKYVKGSSAQDYNVFYRFDRSSGKCAAEGSNKGPATGGSTLGRNICSYLKC